MPDCIFCQVIAGELPSHKIYEDDDIIAILDIFPVNRGHTVVIPKKHAKNMLKSEQADIEKLMEVVRKIAPAILKSVGTEQFNLTANIGELAGQSIFHTHFHVIPRFPEDGHSTWKSMEDKGGLDELAEKIRNQMNT